MTKFTKLFFLGLMAIGFLAFVPVTVNAQVPSGTAPCTTGQDCPQQGLEGIRGAFPAGATRDRSVAEIARTIINWALYIAAIVAVIFIIIGGFLYITSAGDPGRATKGRTTLTNALIGLVIVVLSYMLVQVIYNFISR